jgi:hypothetical protein
MTTTATSQENSTVRIRLTVDGQTATATLNGTPTARDFASLLPLNLNMRDLFGREKPGELPRPLAAGEGQATYEVGGLGYWVPSHDLATARQSQAPASSPFGSDRSSS